MIFFDQHRSEKRIQAIAMMHSFTLDHNLLSYYIIFGALHELSHVAFATILNLIYTATPFSEFVRNFFADGILTVAFRTLLARQCSIPFMNDMNMPHAWVEAVIRHSGWVASILLAVLTYYLSKHQKLVHHHRHMIVIASTITALESLWTDLLQLSPIPVLLSSSASSVVQSASITYLCGNFGIIIINSIWMSANNGEHILDILERMQGCQQKAHGLIKAYPRQSEE